MCIKLLHIIMHFILMLCITFSLSIAAEQQSEHNSRSTLKSVHVYIRHGWRAPACVFKGDISDPRRWPNGLREITQLGKVQSMLMGRYLRDRYRNFYPKDSRFALIQSVQTDRRLDSGAIIINQLWPASRDPTWIAPRMFSLPYLQDLAFSWSPYCPNFDIEFAKFLASDEVLNFLQSKKSLIDIMVSQLGINGSSMLHIFAAADALYVTKFHNYPVPEWAIPYWQDVIDILNALHLFQNGNPLLLRLRAGQLFRDFGLRLDQVMSGNVTIDGRRRNFYLYPAHSGIMTKILLSLNIPHLVEPPFGSMIIFELHTINNRNIVRTFYINETEYISKPISGHQILLNSCNSYDCSYDVFRSLVANSSVDDVKTECGIPDDYKFYNAMQDITAYPTEYLAGPDGTPINILTVNCPFGE